MWHWGSELRSFLLVCTATAFLDPIILFYFLNKLSVGYILYGQDGKKPSCMDYIHTPGPPGPGPRRTTALKSMQRVNTSPPTPLTQITFSFLQVITGKIPVHKFIISEKHNVQKRLSTKIRSHLT